MTESSVAQDRLRAFNEKLRKHDIQAYWLRPPRESHDEQPKVLKWKTIYPLLLEAGDVVRLGGDAFRRNMAGYQRWHQHRNRSTSKPAILFSISDCPIAQAFGLYREEGR